MFCFVWFGFSINFLNIAPAKWGSDATNVFSNVKLVIFRVTGPLRGIHRSPVNSPLKSQWRGALMFYLICDWINGWENNGEAGDLRRHRAHYDVILINPLWIHVTSTSKQRTTKPCAYFMGYIETMSINARVIYHEFNAVWYASFLCGAFWFIDQ